MKLFFDNNLPPRTARALHCLLEPDGLRVVHLHDLFKPDAKDTDWITTLGREGEWVIFTSDHDIIRRRVEKLVWRQQRMGGVHSQQRLAELRPTRSMLAAHQTLA